jgi:hypothetical protein
MTKDISLSMIGQNVKGVSFLPDEDEENAPIGKMEKWITQILEKVNAAVAVISHPALMKGLQ